MVRYSAYVIMQQVTCIVQKCGLSRNQHKHIANNSDVTNMISLPLYHHMHDVNQMWILSFDCFLSLTQVARI